MQKKLKMSQSKKTLVMRSTLSQNIRMYTKLNVQGQGNFGQVFLGQHKQTKQYVAIKRIQKRHDTQQGISVNFIREIAILKKLNHPNVVKLLNYCVGEDQEQGFIIMEYLSSDLEKQLAKGKLSSSKIKWIIYEIIKGLNYCHQNYIIHRDIKPSNILLNYQQNLIKIGDFGIAKQILVNPRQNTTKVAALYYRAPQLLLQDNHTSFPIDIWGLGCIFAECALGTILFKTEIQTQYSQMNNILKFFQVPMQIRTSNPKNIRDYLKQYQQVRIQTKYVQLTKIMSQQSLDVLNRMLQLDPSRRITAKELLSHSYFKQQKTAMQEENPFSKKNYQYQVIIHQASKI